MELTHFPRGLARRMSKPLKNEKQMIDFRELQEAYKRDPETFKRQIWESLDLIQEANAYMAFTCAIRGHQFSKVVEPGKLVCMCCGLKKEDDE